MVIIPKTILLSSETVEKADSPLFLLAGFHRSHLWISVLFTDSGRTASQGLDADCLTPADIAGLFPVTHEKLRYSCPSQCYVNPPVGTRSRDPGCPDTPPRKIVLHRVENAVITKRTASIPAWG